jgi:hypothetical protein
MVRQFQHAVANAKTTLANTEKSLAGMKRKLAVLKQFAPARQAFFDFARRNVNNPILQVLAPFEVIRGTFDAEDIAILEKEAIPGAEKNIEIAKKALEDVQSQLNYHQKAWEYFAKAEVKILVEPWDFPAKKDEAPPPVVPLPENIEVK